MSNRQSPHTTLPGGSLPDVELDQISAGLEPGNRECIKSLSLDNLKDLYQSTLDLLRDDSVYEYPDSYYESLMATVSVIEHEYLSRKISIPDY